MTQASNTGLYRLNASTRTLCTLNSTFIAASWRWQKSSGSEYFKFGGSCVGFVSVFQGGWDMVGVEYACGVFGHELALWST
jgi:hypothetical protein